jgi:CMP-N,N'-diacetyllegionaminic acid synthase
MITWTIDVVKDVNEIEYVLVSTDDKDIAKVALESGAFVPWLRPVQLATDIASSVDVAIHALDWYESKFGSIDGLILLQPTSPFRTRATVEEGIHLFKKYEGRPVLAVTHAENHSLQNFIQVGEYIYLTKNKSYTHSHKNQDSTFYKPTGSLYIVSPSYLRREKSFTVGEVVPVNVASSIEALDIDTQQDWELAQSYISANER